jgi:hypothetical protein
MSAPEGAALVVMVPETEPTPEGEQMLIPGVRAIGLRERLALRLAAPLMPIKLQKPLNIGLFDDDVFAVIWNPAD